MDEPEWQAEAPPAFVLELVGMLCAERLPWVVDSLEVQVANAAAAGRPSRSGRLSSAAERWMAAASEMLDELDDFADSGAESLSGYLDANAHAAALLSSGKRCQSFVKFDGRLRRGALRETLRTASDLTVVA